MRARVKKKPKNKTIPILGTIYNTLGNISMKITKRQLKKIIKEELEGVLNEFSPFGTEKFVRGTPGRADSSLLPMGIGGPVERSLEYEDVQPAGEEFLPMSKEEMIDADIEAALYPQAYQETDITQGREGMPVRLVQRSRAPGAQRAGESDAEARARLGWARKGVPHLPGRTAPGKTQVSPAAIHGLDPRTGIQVSKTPGVGRSARSPGASQQYAGYGAHGRMGYAGLQETIKEELQILLQEQERRRWRGPGVAYWQDGRWRFPSTVAGEHARAHSLSVPEHERESLYAKTGPAASTERWSTPSTPSMPTTPNPWRTQGPDPAPPYPRRLGTLPWPEIEDPYAQPFDIKTGLFPHEEEEY
jgi:hypothetical protein